MTDKKFESVHYHEYLQLDKILGAQDLRSAEIGEPAHDELLFIITHQVYELWFKEIIHNLDSVADMFRKDIVDEKNLGVAVARLRRIIEIFKVLIEQVRVLETMTALDFLDFRNYLLPASGFQSFQFRKIEVLMGLKISDRQTYDKRDYKGPFNESRQRELERLEDGNSMLELVGRWLERTPFLEFGEFNFRKRYAEAVDNMIRKEKDIIARSDYIDAEQENIRLKMLDETQEYIRSALEESDHEALRKEGKVFLSHKATVAALLINLYRDEPILQLPFQLISDLLEIDELMTTWRYRHAQMVLRMLGRKRGTGGSAGYDYLKRTVDQHSIFSDLKNITTMLIPRSDVPELPEELKRRLGFYFSAEET